MPKMKTKSGAKKRFRVRPGGTVKRGQAFKRHILTKKSTSRKRDLGQINQAEFIDARRAMTDARLNLNRVRAEFLARIKSDAVRYKKVVQQAGVKPG